MRKTLLVFMSLLCLTPAARAEQQYQKPPQAVLDVLNAPLAPWFYMNPSHDTAALIQPVRYPPIADLAMPMLRLAGVRINPRTNGLHGASYGTSFTLKQVAGGAETPLSLPAGARVGGPRWSADGKRFAFTNELKD